MAHVVNLLGGTGNQLFQYLFGETVGMLTNEAVVYDAGDFATYMLHGGFSLVKVLDVDLPLAGSNRPFWLRNRRTKRLLAELPPTLGKRLGFRTDRDFSFAGLHGLRPDQYFYGFWQGVDYPLDTVAAIISRLQFRGAIVQQASETAELLAIDLADDIAIHVRLGDYLRLPRSPHLPLSADYYLRAVARLKERGVNGRVFVFSDDVAMCRGMFAGEADWCYVGGQSAAADLCLMAMMGNTVISASTFGWWAGALTASPKKHVIYPHPWVKARFIYDAHASPPPLPGWESVPSDPLRSIDQCP